jgi:lysophospholipase L1-like esterase
MTSKMKLLGLVVLATLLALLAAELAVRAFHLAPELGVVQKGRYRLSANPLIGYELVPRFRSGSAGEMVHFKGQSNDLGFRDRDHQKDKPRGVYRIIVLGDSIAQGMGIDDDADLFTSVLQRRLSSVRPGVEVLNFGVSGYNTQQEVETLREKGLAYGPDLVVLAYGSNDRRQSCGTLMDQLLEEQNKHSHFLDFHALTRHSALFRLLYFRFASATADTTGIYDSLKQDTVASYLGILSALSGEKGFDVLVAAFPICYDLETGKDEKQYRFVQALAQTNRFHYLDLFPAFRLATGKEPLFSDIFHPTVRGHLCAGDAIADFIATNVWARTDQNNAKTRDVR